MPIPQLDHTLPCHPLGPYQPKPGGRPRSHAEWPSCRGGGTRMSPVGYVLEYSPDHPGCNAAKLVLQHRLVMECILGRMLDSSDIVHHKNRDRTDNRASNLELTDRKSHALIHRQETRDRCLAPLCEESVREALQGRTTAEAALVLGVTHSTLRNRFPSLLNQRRSPGGEFHELFVSQLRTLALDPSVSTRKAADILRSTPLTIRSCCRKHGIEWTAAPSGRPIRPR